MAAAVLVLVAAAAAVAVLASVLMASAVVASAVLASAVLASALLASALLASALLALWRCGGRWARRACIASLTSLSNSSTQQNGTGAVSLCSGGTGPRPSVAQRRWQRGKH